MASNATSLGPIPSERAVRPDALARRVLFTKRVRQWSAVALMAVAWASYNTISDWQKHNAFLINASDSLPNWAFFVHLHHTPAKDDYVFFAPPANPLVRRHFGPDSGPFGKRVIGMPGALVEHRGSDVYVDGIRVAHMKPFTRTGEPLTPGPVGRVPRGCYYVGTPHPDGFDSRYAEIGFACANQVIGTGTPIL
ncbi:MULTISPECIES: S26 family signal peptidase [unclassified Sphingomonas]|uniref:S26 family signal peptidase n=1 Tax=unclassified Sphingomonas TaxID=196159 RepID=UPI0017C57F35|nr:S26 family signal peptidase [Sphingomonas sp. BK481]MBB3588838.1 conjugal transfer pilin signal peptidase TrbI [Sphingomonas sp. BK481]